MQFDISNLKNFIINDEYLLWDEWGFYFNINSVINITEDNNNSAFFSSLMQNTKYLCSLGKSGLVLTTILSEIKKLPIYIFSVGEFVDNGHYIIGLPKEVRWFLHHNANDGEILVIDSHIRSGNTVFMAEKYFVGLQSPKWFILFDCRDIPIKNKMQQHGINTQFLFNLESENEKKLITEKVKDLKLIENDDFWMKKEKYWLSPSKKRESCNLNASNELTINEIEKSIIRINISKYIKHDNNFIIPQSLYWTYEGLEMFANNILTQYLLNNPLNPEKHILLVTLSLGAVPLGVKVAYKLHQSNITSKLLYPLYRTEEYYKNIIESDNNIDQIVIIDDVFDTGGMLYEFCSRYLSAVKNKISIITIYKLSLAKKPALDYYKYFYNISKKVIERGGKIIVGSI